MWISCAPVLNGSCSIKDESFLFCFGAMAHTHIFSSIKGILHCTIIKTFLYTFYNMTKHIGMPTRKIVQIYFYVLVCRAKKCHWNLPKSSKSIHQAQSPPTIFLIWEKTVLPYLRQGALDSFACWIDKKLVSFHAIEKCQTFFIYMQDTYLGW